MNETAEPHFFDRRENVKKYIEMTSGTDATALVEILRDHLEPDSSLLEIGIGPGRDLELLNRHFRVTGSDKSRHFLDLFNDRKPVGPDLLKLDAATLDTDRRFDGIYSNKVLHHLGRDELPRSFARQHQVLYDGGVAIHTFWRGTGSAQYQGLEFNKYDKKTLVRLVMPYFDLLAIGTYAEMNKDDSIYIVLRKIKRYE